MSENGKGSQRRPAAVPQRTYLRNYENTFGPRPESESPAEKTSESRQEPAQESRG